MRASTAVAIFSLATGVAPSFALALPAIKSGRAAPKAVRPLPVPPIVKKPLPPIPAMPDMRLEPLRRPPSPEVPEPEPAKPKPLDPVPKAAFQEMFKSATNTAIATGIIAGSNAIELQSRRELLERFDEQIKLAARAYVRELLTTPMDDLD